MFGEIIKQARGKYNTEDLVIYGRKSTIEKLLGEVKGDLAFNQPINEDGKIDNFEGYPIVIVQDTLLEENKIMIVPVKDALSLRFPIDYRIPLEET